MSRERFDAIPPSEPIEDDLPNEPADARDVRELLGDIREHLRSHIADAKQFRLDCAPDQEERLDAILDALREGFNILESLREAWERLP